MKKIYVNIPVLHDATSFYRGIGPLSVLNRQYQGLQINLTNEWTWATLCSADMLFMQRPFYPDHLKLAEWAKDMNIPLLVDYDDDILDVPTDNPCFHSYGKPEVQRSVAKILKIADHITVSTPQLKDSFRKYTDRPITIVPNAFNEDLFGHYPRNTMQTKLVTWRGSRTHQRDVMGFAQPIIEAANKYKQDWKWQFIGDNLWFLTDYMPNDITFWCEPMDVIYYHKHIHQTAPSLFIVPLHDSDFNKCKSNIAWIEATFSGALTLAPDTLEWQRPGVLNYSDPVQFRDQLQSVLEGHVPFTKVDESWEYIQSELRLRKVNELRMDVIAELLKTDKAELVQR